MAGRIADGSDRIASGYQRGEPVQIGGVVHLWNDLYPYPVLLLQLVDVRVMVAIL